MVSFIKCDLHLTMFDLDLTTFEECDVVDVPKHVCSNEDPFSLQNFNLFAKHFVEGVVDIGVFESFQALSMPLFMVLH